MGKIGITFLLFLIVRLIGVLVGWEGILPEQIQYGSFWFGVGLCVLYQVNEIAYEVAIERYPGRFHRSMRQGFGALVLMILVGILDSAVGWVAVATEVLGTLESGWFIGAFGANKLMDLIIGGEKYQQDEQTDLSEEEEQ